MLSVVCAAELLGAWWGFEERRLVRGRSFCAHRSSAGWQQRAKIFVSFCQHLRRVKGRAMAPCLQLNRLPLNSSGGLAGILSDQLCAGAQRYGLNFSRWSYLQVHVMYTR